MPNPLDQVTYNQEAGYLPINLVAGDAINKLHRVLTMDSRPSAISRLRMRLTVDSDFVESKHPRDADGKFGTGHSYYHQTSKKNAEKIKAEGFSIKEEHAMARLSDELVPNGVFFKEDQRNIGVGATKKEEIEHIESELNISKPLIVRDRMELKRTLGEKWQTMKSEWDKKDREWLKKFNALELKAQTDEDFDNLDKITEEWGNEGKRAASEMRKEIDRELTSKGYDSLIMEEDVGSMGRKTKTIVVFDPKNIRIKK